MKIFNILSNSLSVVYPVVFRKIHDFNQKKQKNNYWTKIFIKKSLQPIKYQLLSEICKKKWSNDLSFEQQNALKNMNLVFKKIIDKKEQIHESSNKILKL